MSNSHWHMLSSSPSCHISLLFPNSCQASLCSLGRYNAEYRHRLPTTVTVRLSDFSPSHTLSPMPKAIEHRPEQSPNFVILESIVRARPSPVGEEPLLNPNHTHLVEPDQISFFSNPSSTHGSFAPLPSSTRLTLPKPRKVPYLSSLFSRRLGAAPAGHAIKSCAAERLSAVCLVSFSVSWTV